jgi:hypothetical protein
MSMTGHLARKLNPSQVLNDNNQCQTKLRRSEQQSQRLNRARAVDIILTLHERTSAVW